MANSAKLKCLPAIVSARTRVLILGSFPGPESLRREQYYANTQNHFWKIFSLESLSYEERKQRLDKAGIGLWDVIDSCRREGSSDTNIRGCRMNDIGKLVKEYSAIRTVLLNGKKAGDLFARLELDVPFKILPSTSPANAIISFEEKMDIWRNALRYALCKDGKHS
ncbi:MAG: DNA-deoxyinosine glycosylase [Candidatus Omnitrophica bacterium]|nr:DNA-deoxyinosine glycosylase [Candidatus Omnitrophota bacterium]